MDKRAGKGKKTAYKAAPKTDAEKRARKSSANRSLTILKAILNKAFQDEKVADDTAWRRVKPFENADDASLLLIFYIEILNRYNGSNNADIPLSCREAAELCTISKGNAARAFRELQDRGFIRIGQPAGFNMKKRTSTRWILTHEAITQKKTTPPIGRRESFRIG